MPWQDLAFARTGEQQQPWPLEILADESAAAAHFYSDFSVHVVAPIALPAGLQFSDHFFGRAWEGPRRLKNAIVMLEWIPSPETLGYDSSSTPLLAEDAAATQARHAPVIVALL